MPTRLLATLLAIGLTTPTTAHAHAWQRTTADAALGTEQPVNLVINASDLGGDAKRTSEVIQKQATEALAKEGLRHDPSAATELRVTIRFLDQDRRDYITALEVYRDGTKVEPGLTPFECLTCVTADLSDRVADQIPDAAKLIQQAGTEAAATEPASTTTAAEPAPSTTDREPKKSKASIGPLGIVGIVSLVGGTAGVIAGGVFLAKGEETKQVGMGEVEVVDHRPKGYAALGVGLGVFALGAVFIAVDQTVLKKRRNKQVTWIPAVDRRMVGVQILGRF